MKHWLEPVALPAAMNLRPLTLLVLFTGLVGCSAHMDDPPPLTTQQKPMPTADLKNLEDELYKHGLAGFRRIRAAHPNDKFYCYAFYTSGEFSYVALTASTNEGLDKVAREYQKKPPYSAMSVEDLKIDLKWSPDDSPLHSDAQNVLTALDPWMESVSTELRQRSDQESFNEFADQLRVCFANALKRIDAEGVFGSGEERKTVVINLLMGDQSDDDRIRFAERVNPPEAVEMLKEDLEAASRLRR